MFTGRVRFRMFPQEQSGTTLRELLKRTASIPLQPADIRMGNSECFFFVGVYLCILIRKLLK